MKAQHSIGMPVRCEISAIGWMSAMTRARGAVGRDLQPLVRDLARQPLDVPHDVRPGAGQADVGGVDAERSIRCRMRSFSSMVGQRTDGDCSPSRSVSSSSRTVGGFGAPACGSSRRSGDACEVLRCSC